MHMTQSPRKKQLYPSGKEEVPGISWCDYINGWQVGLGRFFLCVPLKAV